MRSDWSDATLPMHMSRRCQRPIAYLLTLLVLGAGFLPDVVLCVGENGHRAFEMAAQACCHPHKSSEADCASSENHCSPDCNDLQLAVDAMLSKGSASDLVADFAMTSADAALLPAASLYTCEQNRVSSWAQSAPSFNSTPRERHTTVQLC